MNAEKSFHVNVIVFREEDSWTALALEMNVRGYGAGADAAVEDVIHMLQAQITFAVQRGHLESVWHPAEQHYWEMWETARRERFLAEASGVDLPLEPIAEYVPLDLLALKHKEEWIATRA